LLSHGLWPVQDFEDFILALLQKWFLITALDCAEVPKSCSRLC